MWRWEGKGKFCYFHFLVKSMLKKIKRYMYFFLLITALFQVPWIRIVCWMNEFVIAVAQSRSPVWLFATPWTAAHQACLFFTISWSLFKLMSIESVMPSNHLILCCPLLLLPSIFPSIRVFSNELALCIRWPEYWRFSISSSNECSGLIFFRIDCFDFLAVQGTLRSLLQHHSSKASILWLSAFFMVQLSR